MDVDDLVRRCKDGRVARSDIADVARLLSSRRDDERAYQLLHVLARSSATEYEELAAIFLDFPENPMVSRLALQALCTFWGLTGKYVDEVRRFVDRVPRDCLGDVRQGAISAAGEHLPAHTDCALLKGLLAIGRVEDPTSVERRVALEALARALGEPLSDTLRAGGANREQWAADVLVPGRP
ncbi:hypothetical protein ACRAKI_29015 [Saccharothrix isguenensis]